jgi:hypothetical protein
MSHEPMTDKPDGEDGAAKRVTQIPCPGSPVKPRPERYSSRTIGQDFSCAVDRLAEFPYHPPARMTA